jgi:hypothetical protein
VALPPQGGVLPFRQAQGELWGQLKSGRLVACGIRVGESVWGQLAPDDWRELDHYPCGERAAIGSMSVGKYHDVILTRIAILELWPKVREVGSRKRGRKPKMDNSYIKGLVFDLLDDRGDFHPADATWRVQGDLERAVRTKLETKYEKGEIIGKTQLRSLISEYRINWIEHKTGD